MLINVTVPVFNEETQLARSIQQIELFLRRNCAFDHEIVIANNGSTDRTQEVAEMLRSECDFVRLVCLPEKGRGRALRKVWLESSAEILSYMDVDLSTELVAFQPLIQAVVDGGFDVATGSRLLKPPWTTRCWRRELVSRSYNFLVKAEFRTGFTDAQCGFKAITRRAVKELLPWVKDEGWFFDTELLVLAEKLGYRIYDLPVHWVEDTDSRVHFLRTALADLKGILRLRRTLTAILCQHEGRRELHRPPH